MRILITSHRLETVQRIRDALAENNIPCPDDHDCALDQAAMRARRFYTQLIFVGLPEDRAESLSILSEIRKTVPEIYIVAVGPVNDGKFVLQVLHEMAEDYLDEESLGADMKRAIDRFLLFQSSTVEQKEIALTVAVLGAGGGCGASTVAGNLGVALAKLEGQCCLFDLRYSASDLASILGLSPQFSMADLCDRLDRLDQSIFEQVLVRHPSGTSLVAASRYVVDTQRVTQDGVHIALAMARIQFPSVVIENDATLGPEQIEAISHSDHILMVMRLDPISVSNARRALRKLVESGVSLERVRLIANGCGQAKQFSVRQVEESVGLPVSQSFPYDPSAVNDAIIAGTPVLLHRPRSAIAKGIEELAAYFHSTRVDK